MLSNRDKSQTDWHSWGLLRLQKLIRSHRINECLCGDPTNQPATAITPSACGVCTSRARPSRSTRGIWLARSTSCSSTRWTRGWRSPQRVSSASSGKNLKRNQSYRSSCSPAQSTSVCNLCMWLKLDLSFRIESKTSQFTPRWQATLNRQAYGICLEVVSCTFQETFLLRCKAWNYRTKSLSHRIMDRRSSARL